MSLGSPRGGEGEDSLFNPGVKERSSLTRLASLSFYSAILFNYCFTPPFCFTKERRGEDFYLNPELRLALLYYAAV